MGLKAVVKSLDEVPEAVHDLYVQVGDEFVLDVDDGDFKSRLSEFRTNNIQLRKELETKNEESKQLADLRDQLEKYNGIDPERAAQALQKIQDIEEKKLIDSGQIDELLAQRTERMRLDLSSQVDAALKARDDNKSEAEKFRGLYQKEVIDSNLSNAITNVGKLRSGAMFDALNRGRNVWKLNDEGVPTPYTKENTVMYGKDGEKPITMEEWAQSLMSDAPWLYEGNAGGGAGGNLNSVKGGNAQVSLNDSQALSDNLEGIAAGTTQVINE